MAMRRAIGISLAFLVISGGAIAKAPEKSQLQQAVPPLGAKPAKGETSAGKLRNSCGAGRSRSSTRDSARHSVQPDANPDIVRPAGRREIGTAAWYSLVGRQTSSGERLDTVTATAAHRSLPLASYAKVTSLASGRSVIVKINDRGPQSRRFIIDLSPRAADEIDLKRTGVASVMVEPVVFRPALANETVSTITAFHTSSSALGQQSGL